MIVKWVLDLGMANLVATHQLQSYRDIK